MEIQEIKLVLGIIAALLHGFAYLLYNIQAKLGQSKPKAASWSVWAFLAILNAFSYKEMTGDLYAALQFFMGSFACLATFLYVWKIGGFGRIKKKEWYYVAIGLFAALVWMVFKTADWAVLIIMSAFLVSFIPTYEGVRDDPHRERPRSWIIWTVAFAVTIVNKSLGVTDSTVTAMGLILGFAAPVILFFAHGLIAVMSRPARKKRFTKPATI